MINEEVLSKSLASSGRMQHNVICIKKKRSFGNVGVSTKPVTCLTEQKENTFTFFPFTGIEPGSPTCKPSVITTKPGD